ncbi:hypothetical protein L7F22_024547 [Adiantum nelumboides]|nr:hypothetical protein [Adiantum nelumboides]
MSHDSRHMEGLITIHDFDLRSAKSALADIQNQHLLQQQCVQKQLTGECRSSLQLHELSSGSKASSSDLSSISPPPTVEDVQSLPPDDIPAMHASSTAESIDASPIAEASHMSNFFQLSIS